jgi:hypothetical protein
MRYYITEHYNEDFVYYDNMKNLRAKTIGVGFNHSYEYYIFIKYNLDETEKEVILEDHLSED